MSTYTALYRGLRAYDDRHAWQSQLIVERDGRYLQYLTVSVSGRALLGVELSQPTPELMSSLARRSQQRVREALEVGWIPLSNPGDAFDVLLDDAPTVHACAHELTPAFGVGDVVWTFEAD